MKHCLPLLLALLLPAAALAQTVYRWVDANGQVNYSQTPPLGKTNVTVLNAPPPPASAPNQESLNKSLDQSVKDEPKKHQEADTAAAAQAQHDANCRDVMNQLAKLEATTPRHMASKDDSGKVTRWTTEDYDKRRNELQQYLREKCN